MQHSVISALVAFVVALPGCLDPGYLDSDQFVEGGSESSIGRSYFVPVDGNSFADPVGVLSSEGNQKSIVATLHRPRENSVTQAGPESFSELQMHLVGSDSIELLQSISDSRLPTHPEAFSLVQRVDQGYVFVGLRNPMEFPDPSGVLGRDLVRYIVTDEGELDTSVLQMNQLIIRDWAAGDGLSDSYVVTRGYPSNLLYITSLDGNSIALPGSIALPSLNQVQVVHDWVLVAGHHRTEGQVIWVLTPDLEVRGILSLEPSKPISELSPLGGYVFVLGDRGARIVYPLNGEESAVRAIAFGTEVPTLGPIDQILPFRIEPGGRFGESIVSLTYGEGSAVSNQVIVLSNQFEACDTYDHFDFLFDSGDRFWAASNRIDEVHFLSIDSGCSNAAG